MQFSSSCCMFPSSPTTGQISRAIKPAFLFASAFSNTNFCFPCFLLSETGLTTREKFATCTPLTLQIKLPHSSVTTHQKLPQQWKSSKKTATSMWVILKSYLHAIFKTSQKWSSCRKARYLQNYPASADLFLIAWNDSSWQHKANLSSLKRSFKGRRHFLAWGKSWAGNSGYKAQNRVGAILKSASTYYNT